MKHKDADQRNKYRAWLEEQHIARARQEFKESGSNQPFNIWFKAWNQIHMKPLRPKKPAFKNTHLDHMTWEDS